MNTPRRKTFFTLDSPIDTGIYIVAHMDTETEELAELARNFPGVAFVDYFPHLTRIIFDANFDYEETWLLLNDALTEANARLMADENLTNTFELDDLDMSGI